MPPTTPPPVPVPLPDMALYPVNIEPVWWAVLLAPFTLLWWLWVLCISVYVITALEYEKYWHIGGVFIITLLAFCIFGGINVPAWIVANPVATLWIFLAYFGIGAVYSVLKWGLFTSERRREYDDLKQKWLRHRDIEQDTVPNNLKVEWKNSLFGNRDHDVPYYGTFDRYKWWVYVGRPKRKLRIMPVAWEYKSRITSWIAVWPWSAFWTLFNDVFRRLAEAIQRSLANLMDAIGRWSFQGTEDDFDSKDK